MSSLRGAVRARLSRCSRHRLQGREAPLGGVVQEAREPTLIRADNGREFIAETLLDWLGEQQVRGVFIAKASPWQNGINERFNGTMERELFGHEVYHSILEVQFVVNAWVEKYNTMRVHRSLGGQTPAGYVKMLLEATPYELGVGSR